MNFAAVVWQIKRLHFACEIRAARPKSAEKLALACVSVTCATHELLTYEVCKHARKFSGLHQQLRLSCESFPLYQQLKYVQSFQLLRKSVLFCLFQAIMHGCKYTYFLRWLAKSVTESQICTHFCVRQHFLMTTLLKTQGGGKRASIGKLSYVFWTLFLSSAAFTFTNLHTSQVIACVSAGQEGKSEDAPAAAAGGKDLDDDGQGAKKAKKMAPLLPTPLLDTAQKHSQV